MDGLVDHRQLGCNKGNDFHVIAKDKRTTVGLLSQVNAARILAAYSQIPTRRPSTVALLENEAVLLLSP